MTDPNYHEPDVDAARAALQRSQESTHTAETLIVGIREDLASIKMTREANHFADKIRAILRGQAA